MFSRCSVDSPLDLVGPLALNNHLDNAERILEGRLIGPENLVVVDGVAGKDIYTGLNTGEVVRINGNHITHVAKFGQPCEGIWEERKCGRPLGMVYDADRNQLIVADTYYGIWEVDVKSGAKKQLIAPDTEIQGENPRPAALFNSVALHSNGDIYFTDSSSEFPLEDGLYTVMANPSGRLIHWDRKKNVATALVDELAFANGLVINPGEDFIVVAETQRARVIKYHLKGPKKGTYEPFLSGLPGHPDNLTPSTNGFWIPLVIARDSSNPSLMASLGQVPLVRKFLIRMLYLIEFPFKLIQKAVPNTFVQKVIHKWGHFSMFSAAFPDRQTLIKVDWNGKIIGALHTTDKSVHSIAHVVELGEYLYMGGPFINYMGRVKLSAAAKKLVQFEEKSRVEATTSTTPKPATTTTTTTTPKPPTTTTTPKPATTTTTTTPKPTTTTTTTTPKPPTTTTPAPKPAVPRKEEDIKSEPAPVHEQDPKDLPPPPPQKMKIIKKGGVEGEL